MSLSQSSATPNVAPRSQRLALTAEALALPPSPLLDRTVLHLSNRSTTHDVDLGGIDVQPGEGLRLGPGERIAVPAQESLYGVTDVARRVASLAATLTTVLNGRLVAIENNRIVSSTDGVTWTDGGIELPPQLYVPVAIAVSASYLVIGAGEFGLYVYTMDNAGVATYAFHIDVPGYTLLHLHDGANAFLTAVYRDNASTVGTVAWVRLEPEEGDPLVDIGGATVVDANVVDGVQGDAGIYYMQGNTLYDEFGGNVAVVGANGRVEVWGGEVVAWGDAGTYWRGDVLAGVRPVAVVGGELVTVATGATPTVEARDGDETRKLSETDIQRAHALASGIYAFDGQSVYHLPSDLTVPVSILEQ